MKALLLLPFLVVLVSGCVLPGGISLPGLPGFGTEISYENDVLIIKDLRAIPTTISKSETTRVIAYVENRGSEKIGNAEVRLYDYCSGVFAIVGGSCDGNPLSAGENICQLKDILSKETKAVEWELRPQDIKLTTPCNIKMSVNYTYQTDGLTTISFINQQEYQRQLELGTFRTKSSDIVRGEGPIKAWFDVKSQQPIPSAPGTTPVSLEIVNMGSGFLATPNISEDDIKVTIPLDMKPKPEDCEFFSNPQEDTAKNTVTSNPEDDVKLIQNRRSIICQMNIPQDISKELTKQLAVSLEYAYEFRSQTSVTVQG